MRPVSNGAACLARGGSLGATETRGVFLRDKQLMFQRVPSAG